MTTAREADSSLRWVLPPPRADECAAELCSQLPRLDPRLARVLAARGFHEASAVREFLSPSLDRLHDPLILPDMPAAVDRLEAAIDAGETVFVHGDFDADGMCATALAVRGLRRLGARALPFVPHRTKDGYDLRPSTVKRAAAAGADLILTVDCGITAVDAVEEARAHGIEVVVTDHHRPGPELPRARAVVNPMRPEGPDELRGLAGVGVAFQLIAALFSRRGFPRPELFQHLDLVAVGTVADRMPLTGENRTLVRAGLRALARTRKPGLRALLGRARIDPSDPVVAEDIAFRLGPRLNSVGRMAAAQAGVRLLLTDDPSEAEELARHLDEQNAERRRTDRAVTEDVERRLAEQFDASADGAVVVWGEGWHPGVVGIVASRIVERWRRPAVVVSFDGGGVGQGSGRSVEGFHLYEALEECRGLLEGYGGHRMAAGLRIRRDRIEEFAARIRKLAAGSLAAAHEPPALQIDLEVPLAGVDRELADLLAHLAPHGEENPAPVLLSTAVRLEDVEAVGRAGGHLRGTLRDGEGDGARLRMIAFGKGDRAGEVRAGARFDVAFHLERDRYRGRERLQARVVDLRASA